VSNEFYKTSILQYSGIIIKICRAYSNSQEDFEDYYQEVCLQIWRSKENFKGKSEWSTWVYRLSLNVCLTLLKKETKRNDQYSAREPISIEINQDDQTFSEDSLNQLYSAIKQLSKIDRAVIILYLEERSYQEISEIMGTSTSNIGVRINRIKKRLKKIINGKIN